MKKIGITKKEIEGEEKSVKPTSSSDNFYCRPSTSKEKKKRGKRKKGHSRVRQELLGAIKNHHIYPERCK